MEFSEKDNSIYSLDLPIHHQYDRPLINFIEDTNSLTQDSAILVHEIKNNMD